MSWLAKLYETYDGIEGLHDTKVGNTLWPMSHFVKNAHIEVVVDIEGNFQAGRAKILNGKDGPTLIPATEASAGRAGAKIAPHPLCEEIGYCAADYPKANLEKTTAYLTQLNDWAGSTWTHPKVKAIYKYLAKQKLWSDLSSQFEFPLKVEKADGTSLKIPAEKVFIRWSVDEVGNPIHGTWQDDELINAWIAYDRKNNNKRGFCHVLGGEARIASNHPRFIRWPGDGAKIVSSNDASGFTFRGRFTDSKKSIDESGAQAVCIGFDVTQKAHNALRWLISHQGHRNGDQIYVAWAVSGKSVPAAFEDPWAILGKSVSLQEDIGSESENGIDHGIDLGASLAHKFNEYLNGFGKNLEPNEQIVVIGLDSATTGRMGIVYYRELLASEFLLRLDAWHTQFAWPQRHAIEVPNSNQSKQLVWPTWSPPPKHIAEAAYGDILKSNDSLRKSLHERILPCIVDGRPFPRDILNAAIRRASNRNNCEHWEWERNLGVACALYRGFHQRHPDENQRRKYTMTLEEDNRSRDYLYGRLLAIAERIEEIALSVGGENRPTTAARLMQRFADRPSSTWRNIELGIQPYMHRLQGKRPGFLTNRKKELDAVISDFKPDDFTSDKSLSGEFLLGYHCQRMIYRNTQTETTLED
ncbi:MAG: type I-C CRISPR-associated protein Cas8c/Csd1 [Proteobacteria bacterium]|nr:type I-C CRISPR-associated protein Cas8c/Csd1 [Pseudomonadota bacterium]